MPYRLEWLSRSDLAGADRWSTALDLEGARNAALRLLRARRPAAWVRLVLTGPDGDAEDRFAGLAAVEAWGTPNALPAPSGTSPVAPPEIERLRVRGLAGLDVVLEWSGRHGLLSGHAAEAMRIAFDAAMLGVAPPEPAAPRRSGGSRLP